MEPGLTLASLKGDPHHGADLILQKVKARVRLMTRVRLPVYVAKETELRPCPANGVLPHYLGFMYAKSLKPEGHWAYTAAMRAAVKAAVRPLLAQWLVEGEDTRIRLGDGRWRILTAKVQRRRILKLSRGENDNKQFLLQILDELIGEPLSDYVLSVFKFLVPCTLCHRLGIPCWLAEECPQCDPQRGVFKGPREYKDDEVTEEDQRYFEVFASKEGFRIHLSMYHRYRKFKLTENRPLPAFASALSIGKILAAAKSGPFAAYSKELRNYGNVSFVAVERMQLFAAFIEVLICTITPANFKACNRIQALIGA